MLSPKSPRKETVISSTSPPISPIVRHPFLVSQEYDPNQLVGANPLKTDAELKRQLNELDEITTRKAFTRWRTSFLARYEQFLEQSGTGQAPPAYAAFCHELDKLETVTTAVQKDLQLIEGKIDNNNNNSSSNNNNSSSTTSSNSPTSHVTVSMRRRFAEWNKLLGEMVIALTSLTPVTLEKEKQYGYTKFQLGALLVRNGFAAYEQLAYCEDMCVLFKEQSCLPDIVDRQVLECMEEYQTKLAIFCDIMADLGLYQAMLKCHELNQLPEEKEPEEPPQDKTEQEPIQEVVTDDEQEPQQQEEEEEPPKKEKRKKKKKKDVETPQRMPMTFTLSFPALKPPSGPFIKFVDTGAKTQDQVHKGIHARGKLSGNDNSSVESFERAFQSEDDDDDQVVGTTTQKKKKKKKPITEEEKKKREEESYKPLPKMNFKMDYHGGMNTDAWRITKKMEYRRRHRRRRRRYQIKTRTRKTTTATSTIVVLRVIVTTRLTVVVVVVVVVMMIVMVRPRYNKESWGKNKTHTHTHTQKPNVTISQIFFLSSNYSPFL